MSKRNYIYVYSFDGGSKICSQPGTIEEILEDMSDNLKDTDQFDDFDVEVLDIHGVYTLERAHEYDGHIARWQAEAKAMKLAKETEL